MPDERTSTATTATPEPTSRLRIAKLLSGSASQISTQVVIPRLERIFGPADPGKAQGTGRFHYVLLGLARRVVHFNKKFCVRIHPLNIRYGSLQARHF